MDSAVSNCCLHIQLRRARWQRSYRLGFMTQQGMTKSAVVSACARPVDDSKFLSHPQDGTDITSRPKPWPQRSIRSVGMKLTMRNCYILRSEKTSHFLFYGVDFSCYKRNERRSTMKIKVNVRAGSTKAR
jgi:hypothetical protein